MDNYVALFAALGDRSRSRMVSSLATRPATVSELATLAGISLPATLKHVAVLESAGVVTRSKTGRTVTVRLEPAGLAEAEVWLRETRAFWATQLGQLAVVLDSDTDSDSDTNADTVTKENPR